MMCKAWTGDWRARVQDRARRLGFECVWDVFAAHPGIPFGQVFRYLRETETLQDIPIAHIQLQAVLFEEAETRRRTKEAIADTLVRQLREHLRSGWNRGKKVPERRGRAAGEWELPASRTSPYYSISSRIFSALEELRPPDNWCPEDIDDPFIQEAFRRAWIECVPEEQEETK